MLFELEYVQYLLGDDIECYLMSTEGLSFRSMLEVNQNIWFRFKKMFLVLCDVQLRK